jgi:hypothetical protein
VPFDPTEFARELGRRLNTDADFRRRMIGDPKTALAEMGLEIDDDRAQLIREALAAGLDGVDDSDIVAPFIIPI